MRQIRDDCSSMYPLNITVLIVLTKEFSSESDNPDDMEIKSDLVNK